MKNVGSCLCFGRGCVALGPPGAKKQFFSENFSKIKFEALLRVRKFFWKTKFVGPRAAQPLPFLGSFRSTCQCVYLSRLVPEWLIFRYFKSKMLNFGCWIIYKFKSFNAKWLTYIIKFPMRKIKNWKIEKYPGWVSNPGLPRGRREFYIWATE